MATKEEASAGDMGTEEGPAELTEGSSRERWGLMGVTVFTPKAGEGGWLSEREVPRSGTWKWGHCLSPEPPAAFDFRAPGLGAGGRGIAWP